MSIASTPTRSPFTEVTGLRRQAHLAVIAASTVAASSTLIAAMLLALGLSS